MKTITEKWCVYHGQYVYESNASEHQLSACEIIKVQTPVIVEHVHEFEFVDCARPMVCPCGEVRP